jgi:acyl dehydratase
VVLGRALGPFEGRLDADLVRRYALVTGDPAPAAQAGEVVPITGLAILLWEAQEAGRAALVPEALTQAATGGVHGEHDVVLHRPVVPGEPLRTWVEGHGARPAGRNAAVTLRYRTLDAAGGLVAEQWWTAVWLGVACEPAGEAAPAHAFPDGATARPIGRSTLVVDEGMARRYAEVSGDWSPHHFDAEAARRSGADRPFLHGLCTMALCARAAVELVADGDPERLGRIAVRFAAPMPVGEAIDVDLFDAGALGARGRGIAFVASSGGTPVVTHGRAELR